MQWHIPLLLQLRLNLFHIASAALKFILLPLPLI